MAYVFTDGELLTAAKLNAHAVNPDSGSTTVGALTAYKEGSGLMIMAGRVQVTIATAGTAASTSITFPETFLGAPFPRVSLTPFSNAPSVSTPVVVTAAGLSTTGVTVWANRGVVGTIDIDVVVIGKWK